MNRTQAGFAPLDHALDEVEDFIPFTALMDFKIAEAVIDHNGMTDGGAASLSVDTGIDIPKNALVYGWAYQVLEDLAANDETGYNIQMGDGTDADRFNPGTDPAETIASQSTGKVMVVPGRGNGGDGVLSTDADEDVTVTVTLTGGSTDASNVTAGRWRFAFFYLDFTGFLDAMDD